MDWRDFSRSANVEDRRAAPMYVPELESSVIPMLLRSALYNQVQNAVPLPPPTQLGIEAGGADAGRYHYPVPLDTLLSPYLLHMLLGGHR